MISKYSEPNCGVQGANGAGFIFTYTLQFFFFVQFSSEAGDDAVLTFRILKNGVLEIRHHTLIEIQPARDETAEDF